MEDNDNHNHADTSTRTTVQSTHKSHELELSHHHHHCLAPTDNVETLQRLARVPYLFRYDGEDKPPEATALALDVFGRGAVIMSSIFLGPALLELAQDAVVEACQGDTACLQDGRIYGFRPSSVLSNIAIVSGLMSSIFMPVFGALVDHTPHRWSVGAMSASGLVVVKGVEAMVSASTWFIVAILQVVSSILYNLHVTTTLAYTSELSTDKQQQTIYNTYYTMVLYISNLIFLAWVITVATAIGVGDVGTARISQLTTSSIAAITFGSAWTYFFRSCPALSRIPQGQTLWSVGFYKVGKTFAKIVLELPALKWLNLAVMFGEAATSTITSVGTTFMKSFMLMDANEIAVVFLAVLIMGAPGSKLGGWVALKTDAVTSAMICNTIYLASTTIAAMVFTSPEHKAYMPLLGMIWGLCMGWLFPMHQTAVINLIPQTGQQAEFMGIYILSGQLISWMPPLLFTALNEAGLAMSWGLASMGIFYLIAILCLILVHVSSSSSYSPLTTGVNCRSSRLGHYDTPPEAASSASASASASASEYEGLMELKSNPSQDSLTNTCCINHQQIQQRKTITTTTTTKN